MGDKLKQAIKEWQEILNQENIILDEPNLSLFRLSSLGHKYNTKCALRPSNLKQLSLCLSIANRLKISIYPVSKGQNHGYNSATPASNDCVAIDLRFMNKIIEFNTNFGYVIIEPGVTFKDLYNYLAKHHSEYLMSGFSGSSNASVMGNALDRGIGKGFYGNREISSEIREIVLSDGNIVDLKDRFVGTDLSSNIQFANVGVNLNSLFYQSNLAIVTKIIIYLEPIPNYLLSTNIKINSDSGLYNSLEVLRRLDRGKVISPIYTINNDVRLLMGSGMYRRPIDYTQAKMQRITDEFCKNSDKNIRKWNISLSIHCYCESDLLIKKEILDKEFSKNADIIQHTTINSAEIKDLIFQSINEKNIHPKDMGMLFNLGYTNNNDQNTLYWNSNLEVNQRTNPVADGCGLIFFTPKVPFTISDINKAVTLLQDTTNFYNRENPITIQFKSSNIACMIIPILFKLNEQGSVKLAHNFHQELLNIFTREGYFPNRPNSISKSVIFDNKSGIMKLVNSIKKALDNSNLLNPS